MELLRPIFLLCFLLLREALSLSCFVGLGNTKDRDKQPKIDCPANPRYVCVKMFGGGMGDQIKRYCEQLEPEDYILLQDMEARQSEGETFDVDPNCLKTKDKGRDVEICRCSSDNCNFGSQIKSSPVFAFLLLLVPMSSTWRVTQT